MNKDTIINIQDIDTFVLSNVTWQMLVRTFSPNQQAKEIVLDRRIDLNLQNLLLYVRAYSRVLVDVVVGNYNRQYDTSVQIIAACSPGITSDYDVNLVGIGSCDITQQIVNSFHAIFGNSLSEVADTNIYVAPAFSMVSENQIFPPWLKYTSVQNRPGVYFPVPTSSDIFNLELRYVHRKKYMITQNKPTTDDTETSYRKMLEHGRILERFYTSGNGLTEISYWENIMRVNMNAIESYWAVSTVLVVVLEIQLGNRILHITRYSYIVSAFENFIELLQHGTISETCDGYIVIGNTETLLKTSKYVYRTLYSMLRADILNGDEKEHMLQQVEKIVHGKNDPSTTDTSTFYNYQHTILPYLLTFDWDGILTSITTD